MELNNKGTRPRSSQDVFFLSSSGKNAVWEFCLRIGMYGVRTEMVEGMEDDGGWRVALVFWRV